MEWLGSWSWFVAVVGGAALLGLGLAVGAVMWMSRDRRKDGQAERGVRRIYDQAAAREEPVAEDRKVAQRESERQNAP